MTLEDCTQKLGPNGSLIVQGLDEDEDDGGGHDDYTMESKF